uniref:Major facilitator superfamily (MFS) profile domain-containing protein n=1 Tax=Brassica campestris TaxID=3711 RepID=M4EBA1_BRACM
MISEPISFLFTNIIKANGLDNLIQQSHICADDSDVNDRARPEALTFDNIVEHSLSDFGFWQLFQVILVGLALFFDAQQIFITVYTDAYPTWHCLNHTICDHSTSDICQLPRSAWEWDGGSKDKTVISEFGLECSSSLLRGMSTSAFYIGAIVGGFFLALIPDGSLGRKKLVLFSTFAMSITSISVVFSTNVWIYTTLKFVIEITDMGLCHCLESLTLLDTLRGDISISTQPFPQHSIVSSLLYLFALESPRWLHLQGNNEEAKSLSSKNKAYLESLVSKLPLEQTVEALPSYYGVPLAARDIDVNIYLSETLNAVVELPTFIVHIGEGQQKNLCSCEHLTRWSIAGALFRSKRFRKNRSATMMFRQALVVGGACCPLIASIGRDLPSVSFAIFGIAMSGLGLFVLILPETKGSSLCDTMEEQEKRDQTISTSHCC